MAVHVSAYRNGWKKFIGRKMFYSRAGMHKKAFRIVATSLLERWEAIKASGGQWTEQEIEAAYRVVGVPLDGSPRKETANSAAAPPPAHCALPRSPKRLCLNAAIEKYLRQLKTEVPKQISMDHYEKVEQHVRRLTTLMHDLPIDRIEYDDMVRMKNAVINGKKANGQPFAIATITTIMTCIKMFFNYVADSTDWQAPRGFDKAMKVDRAKLAAAVSDDDEEDELEADMTKAFTIDELSYLWRVGTDLGKLILGLGLFAGFTATDIATLRKTMVVIEGDALYIVGKRQKTKHRQKYKTKWWIPPEVATLIRRRLLSTTDSPKVNPNGLLVLMGRKTDNVKGIWDTMIGAHRKNRDIKLSHKYLRKTGGRFIRYGINENWAKQHAPALVTTVERLSKSSLNDHVEQTGEMPEVGCADRARYSR